jgi:hypothetical protein
MLLYALRHNVLNNNMAESAHSSNNHRHRKRQTVTVNGASVATCPLQLGRELGNGEGGERRPGHDVKNAKLYKNPSTCSKPTKVIGMQLT